MNWLWTLLAGKLIDFLLDLLRPKAKKLEAAAEEELRQAICAAKTPEELNRLFEKHKICEPKK